MVRHVRGRSLLVPLLLVGVQGALGETVEEQMDLVAFGNENSSQWRVINDGVMGGLSDGRRRVSEEGYLEFYGNLSLRNNGGFASVRSTPAGLRLKEGDVIIALGVEKIRDREELHEFLEDTDPGDEIEVTVIVNVNCLSVRATQPGKLVFELLVANKRKLTFVQE